LFVEAELVGLSFAPAVVDFDEAVALWSVELVVVEVDEETL